MTTFTATLTARQAAAALSLAEAATIGDGVYPLSEHFRSRVLASQPSDETTVYHLLAPHGDQLAGYAQLEVEPDAEGFFAAELAVHPAWRQQGVGTTMARKLLGLAKGRRLRIWAHGDVPGARRLARRLGWRQSRRLLILRRSLIGPLAEPELPAGIQLRPFEPDHDEQAWLTVNSRAFTHLPDQGGWTLAELTAREAEPWFDPAGFLVAVRESDGELLGFHWTKVHPPGAPGGAHPGQPDQPLGEVYVLAVDPSAHGLGLGTTLTWAGLRYLRSRGLSEAMLYVDESNTAAVGLYQKLGFTSWSTDAEYRSQP